MDAVTYGDWLKGKRKRLKLTQERLADLAGLPRTYINKIERQRIDLPTWETRQRIHRVLGSTEQELAVLGIISPTDVPIGSAIAEAGASYVTSAFVGDSTKEELYSLMKDMTEEEAGHLLSYAKFLMQET